MRDDGTLELKSSIVDALFDLIKFLPDANAKQLILMNLCEFIEDCEFTELSVRILHLLGDEGLHFKTLHTISDIFTIDWF